MAHVRSTLVVHAIDVSVRYFIFPTILLAGLITTVLAALG